MNSISLAFTIVALISGTSLLGVAFDSATYTHMPYGRAKWLTGLLAATILFSFIAVLTSGKGCNDFTVFDYRSGYVPIGCKENK